MHLRNKQNMGYCDNSYDEYIIVTDDISCQNKINKRITQFCKDCVLEYFSIMEDNCNHDWSSWVDNVRRCFNCNKKEEHISLVYCGGNHQWSAWNFNLMGNQDYRMCNVCHQIEYRYPLQISVNY